ncbi:MAG: hypothetical protein SV062_07080 [Thermodesulfobacteriota bacterium]|nr:hypothetical protein [Thermodesulfobacteriota bacterium]
MFLDFYYLLREYGISISPTAFLRLHKALSMGLINSLEDFYFIARSIMIKSEKYFDLYDKIFAYSFKGVEFEDPFELGIDKTLKAMLMDWLKDPVQLSEVLGIKPEDLKKYTPEELVKYFLERLKEQTERHDGGNRWIGTGGTSPVGHSGFHPGGMRVGGRSRNKSAIKLALERRYKDYSQQGPLDSSQIGEALRRLRNMVPAGPKERINIEKTIYETVQNAGEIELVFERSVKDRLKVILMIDNGGWSMDPYIEVCQTVFNYAHAQFKELTTYFFHNCIYDRVWLDPQRRFKPFDVDDFVKKDPETRLIIIGDASMAPTELLAKDGIIYFDEKQIKPGIERLKFLRETFKHSVWLNPVLISEWQYIHTIRVIAEVFSMFELTLDGLERAVTHLMVKK